MVGTDAERQKYFLLKGLHTKKENKSNDRNAQTAQT